MGLGMTRDGKRIVCGSHTQHVDPLDTTRAVLIDVNAMFRKECVFQTSDVTPRTAVDIFFRRHVFPYANCRFFGFYCDSSDRVPQARQKFLKERRYAPSNRPPSDKQVQVDGRNYTIGTEPVGSSDIELITPDSIPAPWPRLWNSAAGKAKLWSVVADCVREKIMRFAAPDTVYVVDPPDGPVWSYPAGVARVHNYGEADAKCAEAAQLYARDHPTEQARNIMRRVPRVGVYCDVFSPQVLIKTIDWDMLISGLFFPPNISIHISTVYVDRQTGDVHFTKGKAKSTAVRVPELLTPHLVGANHCASVAFWILATSGVDYCDGLRAFGFKETAMIAHLPEIRSKPFVNVCNDSAGPRSAVVNGAVLFDHLRAIRRTRATETSLAKFQSELDSIWFCTLYYAGFDAQRPRGGPVMKSHRWIAEDVESVEEALKDLSITGCDVFTAEEFPDLTVRYKRSPTSY